MGRGSLLFSYNVHKIDLVCYNIKMPKEKRYQSKTKVYHVMSRALNKQMLFDDEHDFLVYLNILSQAKKEYDVKIYAYCLMTNHVHLLLFDLKNNISKFMNKINSRYAMYYNKKNGRTGVVFNERFKSEAIEDKSYLITCIRYIHQNPVKSLMCKRTYDYKFSSIHAYRCSKAQSNYLLLVDVNDIYKMFDKKEFLIFNETDNRDKCMDILCNKLNDEEVTKILYDLLKIKNKKEYLKLEEPIIAVNVIKLIDMGIPLMQLSRVTGFCYSKIQRLRIGKDGKVISLTYKERK